MTPIPKGTTSGGRFSVLQKIGFLVYPSVQPRTGFVTRQENPRKNIPKKLDSFNLPGAVCTGKSRKFSYLAGKWAKNIRENWIPFLLGAVCTAKSRNFLYLAGKCAKNIRENWIPFLPGAVCRAKSTKANNVLLSISSWKIQFSVLALIMADFKIFRLFLNISVIGSI